MITEIQTVHIVPNDPVFTKEECQDIITQAHQAGFKPGKVGGGYEEDGVIDDTIRTNSVVHIPVVDESNWIYDRILRITNDINVKIFQFGLFDMEPATVCRYAETSDGSGQFYNWHYDQLISPIDVAKQRKLSFVCLLNDIDEFEGGILETSCPGIPPQTNENAILRSAGQCAVFPSFMRHRVTPVTKGVRYSLVTWISGPRWI